MLVYFGATSVHFLLRRAQNVFFPKGDLFMSGGCGSTQSGNAGVCSSCVEERGRRCLCVYVCVLHCRRGCASHRLKWYVFSSTSCVQQRLAYLAEIISLCLGLFSFIVKDKIKTLLTAICEWY